MRRLLLMFAALACLVAAPAQAQDEATMRARAEDVVRAARGEATYSEVFSPSFVNAVPQAQFTATLGQLREQIGELEGVERIEPQGTSGAATVTLRFRDATASGPLQLERAAPWRVAGFLLSTITPHAAPGETVHSQVAALPGLSTIYFARLDGSEVLVQHNAGAQLAIGSTFKLYVLAALTRAVAEGRHRWDEVVPLTTRSFPSGQLQDWPQGTPLTLQTLAGLMVSISDNTATDQLIEVLGREAVDAEVRASGHSMPGRALPTMTTRELFLLKLGDEATLDRYAAASVRQRRAMLADLGGRELDAGLMQQVFGDGPHHIDVEWFASAHDLAGVYRLLAADPVARSLLAINSGMARQHFAGWTYVGYKGGSEPGVLSLAWLLTDDAGADWVLLAGWNDPAQTVSEARLLGLVQRALAEAVP